MMKYLKKLARKISAVATIMLLLQAVLPVFAAANISKLNQLTAADGIIAICVGFEIKYVRIDENGQATIVNLDDLPQNLPNNIVHCDNCILTDAPLLANFTTLKLPTKITAHIQITPVHTAVLKLSVKLPPARAPPYI